MNELQITIFEIIYHIINVNNVFSYGQSTTYGLKNYIARYSLAADEYFISVEALEYFQSSNCPNPYTRSAIDKKLFTYEHTIPASYILKLLQQSDKSRASVTKILKLSDCVCIVTKTEDKILAEKYRSTMPDSWKAFRDDPFQRYSESNIKLSNLKWGMKGSLKR